MDKITNYIDNFFKRNFKKKFVSLVISPLILSCLYLVDIHLLTELSKTDKIKSIKKITIPQSAGGTSFRSNKEIGYRYLTENNYQFSTEKRRINYSLVQIKISPITKTIKKVEIDGKKITISSGFNGVNKLLLISINTTILFSICYILVVKQITENARLNLVFLNIVLFAIWIYSLLLL